MHEAALHEDNSFVTLTYDDEHFPSSGSVVPRHLELFWKQLRSDLQRSGRHSGKVRYLACGEYGDHTYRPHYHAIIFGFWPWDAVKLQSTSEAPLWTSPFLLQAWKRGNVVVGPVTPGTASYVARYAVKKTGSSVVVDNNPFWWGKLPEFRRLSRRPGLGREWFNRFGSDIRKDQVYLDKGIISPVPRYYLNKLELEDPAAFITIKDARSDRAALKTLQDPHNEQGPAIIANRNARLALSRGKL